MDSAPSTATLQTVSANVRMILRGLLAALGAWRLEPVVAIALYRRIGVTLGQIERMLVRFRAGRLWLMPRRESASRQEVSRAPAAVLPRRFGWLVAMGGHQAACFGSQLQAVLATPDMMELMAASAQAGRILRPLCRALAVELPGAVRASKPAQCGATRYLPRPRTVSEPFRIALPRGVLAAARRQGFGKDR